MCTNKFKYNLKIFKIKQFNWKNSKNLNIKVYLMNNNNQKITIKNKMKIILKPTI